MKARNHHFVASSISTCMRLIIRQTSCSAAAACLQVILDTIEYGALIKKTPVVVGNCTGFAVNRVFFPYTQAACLLVDLGLDPYMIDMIILKGFGMPMGPFRSGLFLFSPSCLAFLFGSLVGSHVWLMVWACLIFSLTPVVTRCRASSPLVHAYLAWKLAPPALSV